MGNSPVRAPNREIRDDGKRGLEQRRYSIDAASGWLAFAAWNRGSDCRLTKSSGRVYMFTSPSGVRGH